MSTAYLGLGSNLGDCASNLREAIALLDQHEHICVMARASFYQSQPLGMAPGTPEFLNTVIAVNTTLSPKSLLATCLNIEERLGRKRDQYHALHPLPQSRTLDIDILLFDQLILNQTELTLPHPQLHLRAFVLQPLWEVLLETNPDLKHPVLGQPIATLVRGAEVVDIDAIKI